MAIDRFKSSIGIVVAISLVGSMVASCSKKIEDTPAYQAACQGPPLRTIQMVNQAMEDGYVINRQYRCIDKASFFEVAKQKAEWEAANTPAAIEKRKAEFAEQRARAAEYREQQAASEAITENSPNIVLHEVDVNTATESDIASVISVGSDVAAQIIEERNKRNFSDWVDLVNRVVGLSAAQTAFYASVCGLTVNGKSLDGAPPNATMAASIYKKYQKY